MIKLVLCGNPLSNQSIYKVACSGKMPRLYMDKKGKERKLDYQWQISKQYHGVVIKYDVEMDIKLFFGNKRRVDYDNFGKIVTDSLMEQVIIDDSQIKKAHIIMGYDKENPRIELIIKKHETK